ncbi:MAG: 4-alpha-glucanotransferase, partial [Planctomycetota bacterium]
DWSDRAAVERTPEAIRRYREKLADLIFQYEFEQYIFYRQWTDLRQYARERGVGLIGDVAIYVADNSADVWANQHLFKLDDQGRPTVVSGVPPDYFSATGQRWGNPIYRWDLMHQRGYAWWIDRLRTVMEQVDLVRLDHFRGFEAYWEVPASEETAVRGEWVKGPGAALFEAVRNAFGGELPIIAEDLGTITPEVLALRETFDLPGMAIMQFAFAEGEQQRSYRPHNYRRNLVAYTGTHDNDTVNGWWADLNREHEGDRRDPDGNTVPNHAIEAERRLAMTYLGISEGETNVAPAFIRALMQSSADLILIPLQDILGLGSEARMNVPGTQQGQWRWRVTPDMLDADDAGNNIAANLRAITTAFDRC